MGTYEVLIIGSGFGGLCAAVNLLKAGIEQFCILERRGFIGGTWCQNSYPGAAVDVPSPLYSLSFAPYPWARMFAGQPELQRYMQHIVDKFGLAEKIRLNTEVKRLDWDDAHKHWTATTPDGELQARFIVNASGLLSGPVTPDVKGLAHFKGASFHSNQWDHRFDYRQKRVAIIGSGASAAQIIPAIAPHVAQLHVFQRTANWILPRPDRQFGPFERRLLGHPRAYRCLRSLIYWKLEGRFIAFKYSKTALRVVQFMARRSIAKQIADPLLRRKLTPDYALGCKRILLSNDCYAALQRSNVTLHAGNESIAHIDESAIVTSTGQRIEVDAMVWATGFVATDGVIPYAIHGRNGMPLTEAWQPFPRAYLGTSVPGFPNLFIVAGPNTASGHTSQLFFIERQVHYILQCIRAVRDANAGSIEVTAEAEAAYTQMIHREMRKTVWHWGGCHSWYQSRSGHVIPMFPGFSFSYYWLTWRLKRGDHRVA